MQPPKTAKQIDSMRIGGRILAEILADLRRQVVPGVSEKELDKWVENEIIRRGAKASYKTPEVNFPGSICISINEEIVHGVPTERVLKRGDVAKFDLVITYQGMMVDSAFTMVVGEEPTGDKKRLLDVTERALYAGIDAVNGPTYTGTIGAAVEEILHSGNLGIVRKLAGHGIGENIHMEPSVPNYGKKNTGKLVKPGDTICIEPMATLGGDDAVLASDKWTYITADKSLSAHFEHTILLTKDGCEILTQLL
jgi:methionyl aminopeptidase